MSLETQNLGAAEDHVVLVDSLGRVCGSAPKATIHGPSTPLHEGFSCYVVAPDGKVLLTQRAWTKVTWPGVWTNACCGHPHIGEALRDAVARRLRVELGLQATRIGMLLPDFAYRAAMADGTVEHELCPVVAAAVVGELDLVADEVADATWVRWDDLCVRAVDDPASLSPWCVSQIVQLADDGWHPARWVASRPQQETARLDDAVDLASHRPSPWWPDLAHADRQPRVEPPAEDDGETDPVAVIRAQVNAFLEQFLTDRVAELAEIDPSLTAIGAEVHRLHRAGGKRLRPAFVYWGLRTVSAPDHPAVVPTAAAVELLHLFALLQDDIMDRSATRRGRPTAHRALAGQHRSSGNGGDSDWFGVGAAILAADLAHVWADVLLDEAPMTADVRVRGRRAFSILRVEVTAGQYLDLRLASDPTAGERAAMRVALLKSARYSVTRPLLLGAALATVPGTPATVAALEQYGDATGMAFQLRDDVLGVFGALAETGKSPLDDLREGKRTVLMLRALRLADRAQRSTLVALIGRPDLDEDGAATVRSIVAATGALASIERLIEAKHEEAVDAIRGLDPVVRRALTRLAELAIQRSW